MTDGRSGRGASWVAAVVSVLILVGGGATAYSDLNASILEMQTRDIATQKQLGKLDEYDARISENVDELGDRMIRSESEQVSIKRTQERIEFTMNEMLKEMKQMNENIIRLDR
tara:strand:- start:5922 stop:6260 length:339 start_codon:yes stop_codon:yes gene_type:complete